MDEVLENALIEGKGYAALYGSDDLHVKDNKVHLAVLIKNERIKKYLSSRGWMVINYEYF